MDGVTREALVHVPAAAKEQPAPVVFVFHGHGGTARNVVRTFAIQRHWPEAIAVYMQGLSTPGRLTDPEGKRPGWQKARGDQQDRDLKFFDAVLARLKQECKVDGKRISATASFGPRLRPPSPAAASSLRTGSCATGGAAAGRAG